MFTLPQDETGSADRGRRLVKGTFKFAGATVETEPEKLWTLGAPNKAWLDELHSFAWLKDLAALGTPSAQKLASELTSSWLELALRYDPYVWAPVVSANRLRAWLVCSNIMPLDAENGAKLTRSATAHVDWLLRRGSEAGPGLPAIAVSIAMVEAAITLEAVGPRFGATAARLEQILRASTLEDGVLISRSPLDTLTALEMISLLMARAEKSGAPLNEAIEETPKRMCRALRFFRVADGGLPIFHGSHEAGDGRLDTALTRFKLPSEPARELPKSGYVKMIGGRVSVIMDTAPAPTSAAERAHASALSLEMTSGRRRIVVNCGSGAHLGLSWSRYGRAATGHSTITLDDAPFAKQTVGRSPYDGSETLSLDGPPKVVRERKEERNGVWVMAAHDGYEADYGVTVTRRLFLSADGGDFRGEDTLQPEGGAARQTFDKRIGKLPRSRRETGLTAEARFHLHPELSVALVAEGEAATLRLPHGEVWVMRQAGGALSIEDSVYLGRWGQPERTSALLVRFNVGTDGGRVRWAFRRVGELDQLPKDLDSLLPLVGAPEDALFGEKSDRDPDALLKEPPVRR